MAGVEDDFADSLLSGAKPVYRIIKALSKDCRKPHREVAQEVGASSKTVSRRLDRMLKLNALDITIGWNPYRAEDVLITIIEISLSEDTD